VEWTCDDGYERQMHDFLIRARMLFDELGNSVLDAFEGIESVAHNLSADYGPPITSDSLAGCYHNEPAICLAAGPSASEYIDEIREALPCCRLFTCDAMTGSCKRLGLAPDWVTTVERPAANAQVHEPGEGWNVIANLTSCPASVAKYSRVCWWLNGDPIVKWAARSSYSPMTASSSSGVLSVYAALHAGCNPIYLVGHDLCFGAGGESHDPGASSLARAFAGVAKVSADQLQDSRLLIDGVKSTYLWDMFRRNIEEIIARFPRQRVIRIGEGLPIAGTESDCLLPSFSGRPLGTVFPYDLRFSARQMRPSLSDAADRVARMGDRASIVRGRLLGGVITHEQAAEQMQISRIIGDTEHAHLLSYLFQTLYSAMLVRVSLGVDYGATVERLVRAVECHAAVMSDGLYRLSLDIP